MKTAAILLAAGFSRRMGRDKALLPFGNRTALELLVATHRSVGAGQIVVVAGANAGPLERLGLAVDLLVNLQPESGMYESVRLGVRALGQDISWFFVHPVDVPLVGRQTVQRLLEAAAGSDEDVLSPVFQGRRGHPPLLRSSLRQRILDDPGTGGLRTVLERCTSREVAVDDRAVILEMNGPEQYEQVRRSHDAELC